MKWIKSILSLVVFIISIVLIIVGQKNIGPTGLVLMLIGLVGVLVLLYLYNRIYR